MSDETLPESWAHPPIGDCCDLNPKIEKSRFDDAQLVHFVPMSAVEALTNTIDVSETRKFGEVKKGYTPFSTGDVIFAKITPCMENGKTAVVPALPCGLAFGSTEFHVLRPRGDLDPLWFFYFLSSRSYRSIAEHNMTGAVGQRRVPVNFIAQSLIPIPPLAEQKRIVAKIEELFSELDAGEESLRVARRQLGIYRQSLLKQAFEGKLTAKWRSQKRDKLESPDQLLARIQSVRQSRYEEQLRTWQDSSGERRKPRAPKSRVVLEETSRSSLPKLPAEWTWVMLGEIADTTVGFAFQSKEFKSEGIRLLRGDNIEPRKLRWANAAHWPESAIDEFRELLVSEGDVILAMDRPVISSGLKVALAKAHDVPCLLVQRVARIIGMSGVENRFLLVLIDQQRFINHCLGHQTGTQLPHISEGQIRAFPVPLCSLPEQQEIIRLLDEQFEVIEGNEREIDAALRQSEVLRQAILHRAFTGRLVPQVATDEPASALLARIRAERDGADSGSRRGKRTTQPDAVSPPQADDLFPEVVSFKPLGKTDLQAGIVALGLDRFQQRDQFYGHTIAEKVVHLADSLADLQLDRRPIKDAAGPNDTKRAKQVEHRARAKGWFRVTKEGPVYYHHAGRNLPALLAATKQTLGPKFQIVEDLLDQLRGMDTRAIEVVATVYASWNNLLLLKAPISDEAIVTEARENWHPRKLEIERHRFFTAIDWLRKRRLAPKGTGKLVLHPKR